MPPPASTPSHTPAPTPPAPLEPTAEVFAQTACGAAPVVSRRPMLAVTGPPPPTVPLPPSAPRSADGVFHWPMNTLPQLPCMPIAELREAIPEVFAMLFDRSNPALVSICIHAVFPPPTLSRARKPTLEACDATSHFDTEP